VPLKRHILACASFDTFSVKIRVCIWVVGEKNHTSGQRILMEDRTAVLSPVVAVNGFVKHLINGSLAHMSQLTNGISIGTAVYCRAHERDQWTHRQTYTLISDVIIYTNFVAQWSTHSGAMCSGA